MPCSFKVPLSKTYCICLLKTFKNDEKWCFLFWNKVIFSHFRDIQAFVQKLKMPDTVHMPTINLKIENISENIGWAHCCSNLAPVMYIR